MFRWSIKEFNLPLKFVWKISRGESQSKRIFIVHVTDGDLSASGEVASITSKDDKSDSLLELFNKFATDNVSSPSQLKKYNLPSHLHFGISSALTHLEVQKTKQSLTSILKTPPVHALQTSFSLPILAISEIEEFYTKFNLQRFSSLKIKISKENSTEACHKLASLYDGPIRIDANESFQTSQEVLNFSASVQDLNIQFLEQPLPASMVNEYKILKPNCPLPLFADESVQNELLPPDIADQFHGINVKLMKAGSYQTALKQLAQAKAMGLSTMLGCMVETSLGIAGAMAIADGVDYFDLDGFLYFTEDPYSLVTENNGLLTYQQNNFFNLK